MMRRCELMSREEILCALDSINEPICDYCRVGMTKCRELKLRPGTSSACEHIIYAYLMEEVEPVDKGSTSMGKEDFYIRKPTKSWTDSMGYTDTWICPTCGVHVQMPFVSRYCDYIFCPFCGQKWREDD